MKRFALDLYDIVGAVALMGWAFFALDVPAGLPWWRAGIGIVLLVTAHTVAGRDRNAKGEVMK